MNNLTSHRYVGNDLSLTRTDGRELFQVAKVVAAAKGKGKNTTKRGDNSSSFSKHQSAGLLKLAKSSSSLSRQNGLDSQNIAMAITAPQFNFSDYAIPPPLSALSHDFRISKGHKTLERIHRSKPRHQIV